MSLRGEACGASAPSSAPASMAKKVQMSSERRRRATGTNRPMRDPAERRPRTRGDRARCRREGRPRTATTAARDRARDARVGRLAVIANARSWSSIEPCVCRSDLHYPMAMPNIAFLECSRCHLHHDAATPQTVCTACSGALYVRYDLSAAAGMRSAMPIGTSEQDKRWSGMWRYRAGAARCGAGHARRRLDADAQKPAARQRLAQGRRRQSDRNLQGARAGAGGDHGAPLRTAKLAAPTAGNAGGALAAYAAAAGIEAHIFMPHDMPMANQVECLAYGAHVTLGGRADLRLRAHGSRAQSGRGLVRYLHSQGAVPCGGQEDHGIRTGGAAWLGISRCGLLSHRRRRGHDRHVEGLRRDGAAGLGHRQAAEDDRGAGGRMRARGACIRAGRGS